MIEAKQAETSNAKLGRWLVDKSYGHFGDYCSECGARFAVGVGAYTFEHCPKCGTKMDLGGLANNGKA